MKILKSLLLAAVTAGAMFGFTACIGNDGPTEQIYQIGFNPEQITFNSDNYWTGCYEPSAGSFTAGIFSFSHRGWADVWDGVSYPAWNGFCPSRVNDNQDHKDDWINNQWGCMPQNLNKDVYLVGNSESVVSENPLENDKCKITMTSMGFFNPKYVFVTNSSYAYYAAKNGTAFNEAFKQSDNFVLNVVGVRNGVMTGHLKFGLMANGLYLTDWALINLEPLGTVDEVLFYVDSTQKNSYGLTVPAYFCMAGLGYSLPGSTAE